MGLRNAFTYDLSLEAFKLNTLGDTTLHYTLYG